MKSTINTGVTFSYTDGDAFTLSRPLIEEAIKVCRYIETGKRNPDNNFLKHAGICLLLADVTSLSNIDSHDLVSILASHWPKWSGSYTYPIGTGITSPSYEFGMAAERRTLWDKSTEYGQLRYELLTHIKDSLIAILKLSEALCRYNIPVELTITAK